MPIAALRHGEDLPQVLQSIFVKLLRLGVTPEVRQHPALYLHRASVNLSINVLRTRKRQKVVDGIDTLEMPAPVDTHEEVRERDERRDRLTEAMASLKPRALEILLLHYKHDYTDAQIAALLGTSRGTIAVTLFRIRARLRALLRTDRSEGDRT